MNMYVIVRDMKHPATRIAIQKARNLEEINEWSTPEEAGKVVANAVMKEVRRQLDIIVE